MNTIEQNLKTLLIILLVLNILTASACLYLSNRLYKYVNIVQNISIGKNIGVDNGEIR